MDDFWQACLEHLRKDDGAPPTADAPWSIVLQCRGWDPERGALTLAAPDEAAASAAQAHRAQIERAAQKAGAKLQQLQILVEPSVGGVLDSHRLFRNLRFDNYVCGHANQLAVAAAEHVALTTGSQYNPLFICGGTGVGKTHLMHAVGSRFLENHPKAKVRAANAAWLAAAFDEAERRSESALTRLASDWQSQDLLLIDDIHRLSEIRASTQAIRFIEDMALSAKQLLLASNSAADCIERTCPRLYARILKGMIVSIEAPEFDMRTAILRTHAKEAGIELPEDAAAFIAKRLKTSGRELEGALAQIAAHQQLSGGRSAVTLDEAKAVLQTLRLQAEAPVTLDSIRQTVADYYGLDAAALSGGDRSKKAALARRAAIYLAKTLTQQSFPEIARAFGSRSAAAAASASNQTELAMNESGAVSRDIRILEGMLRD